MNKRRYILFQYECKKCFTHLAIFLIILLIPIRIAAAYFEFRESNEDKLYKEVVTDYEGGAEQAVIAEIKERYEQYTKLLSDFPNIQIQYAEGKLDKESFQEQQEEYKYISTYLNAWTHLHDNALRYEVSSKQAHSFFYETAWEKLLSARQIDYVYVFMFLILLIPYFFLEETTGMYAIINRLSGYADVRRNKILLGSLATSVCILLYEMIDIIAAGLLSDLPAIDVFVYNLPEYSGMTAEILLAAILFLRLACKIIENIILVIVLQIFQRLIKNKILVMSAILLLGILGNSWLLKIVVSICSL